MKKIILYYAFAVTLFFSEAIYSQTATQIVQDINIGFPGSNASNITKVGNTIYFSADDGIHGTELWKTDGTITQLVTDINPGPGSSNPGFLYDSPRGNMVVVNGTLFFTADDGAHGNELWKVNSLGTAELVKDINPGIDDGLWFVSDDEFSKHINLVPVSSTNTLLFFAANDGIHGWELWKSNGTSGGTTMVKDINLNLHTSNFPYATGPGSNPKYLTAINNILYFSATDEWLNGQELWQSDGTAVGTKLVKDINESTIYMSSTDTAGAGSNPEKLINANGVLFFVADEGQEWNGSAFVGTGKELWRHEPTGNTTLIVDDINPGNPGSNPINFEVAGTDLFFAATTVGTGNELWKCPLPGGSATFVKDINPTGNSDPKSLTNFNGKLYFSANNGVKGTELWTSDGLTSGTTLLDDINQGTSSSNPLYLTVVGPSLYFTADDGVYGKELWETNGSLNSSVMVENIYLGGSGSYPGYLTNVNNTLYFSAEDETFGVELMTLIGNSSAIKSIENTMQNGIQLYPNPSNDFVTISTKNAKISLPYSILNTVGETVLEGLLIGEKQTIDIRELPEGMYFVKIGVSKEQSLKLIKK